MKIYKSNLQAKGKSKRTPKLLGWFMFIMTTKNLLQRDNLRIFKCGFYKMLTNYYEWESKKIKF